jgi:hypothetical protein
MKLKQLFYLLMALPLAFASCETLGDTVQPPVLTLTSDDTLSFDAYGGKGTITYTLENSVLGTLLSVSCDAEWVEYITVTEKDIKFNVATNYGAARDTKVVVSYGELSFEVAILQDKAINGSEGTGSGEPSLELTSKSTMQFKSKGGKGSITYELKNPVENVFVKANCSADWVNNIKVNDAITFNVDANEGDERKARIVVSYGDYGSFTVAIVQNAYGADEEEDEEEGDDEEEGAEGSHLYNVEFSWAYRAPSSEVDIAENQYYIVFTEASERYELHILMESDYDTLKAGTYTVDNENLLGAAFYDNDEKFEFADGEAVVKGSYENGYTFIIDLVDTNSKNHHYRFQGNVEGIQSMVPTEDTRITAKVLEGEYYGNGNYYIILSDNGLDDGYLQAQSNYYIVNLYAEEMSTRSGGYVTIPSGTYDFDAYSTLSEGTFSNENSGYIVTGNYSSESRTFDDGVLEVTSSGITLTVTINGYEHTVTYNGKPMVEDRSESDGPAYDEADVEFEAEYATAAYYGTEYSDNADNFWIVLSDSTDRSEPGCKLYIFDLYAQIGNGQSIPAGTYYIDTESTREPWTVDVAYGGFYQVVSDGEMQQIDYPYSGYVTVDNYGNIEAYVTMYNSGETHHIIYTGGNIIIIDEREDDDSTTGVESTLTGDYHCSFDDHYAEAVYYGDIGNGTYYWIIGLYPNSDIGDYVYLHFFNTTTNLANIDGSYDVSSSYKPSTIAAGFYDDGYAGTMFFNSLENDHALLVDGSADISCDSSNKATVSFVMYDDYGNKVWGDWSGTLEYVDASTRGSSALKANSTLPSKEAKPMQLQKRKEEANAPVKRYTQQTAKRTPLKESLRYHLAR